MLALLTTAFLIFYILVPGILFRFAASFFVKLKLFQRTRTQEATFAVAVAILPFIFTMVGVWYFPVMRHLPFRIPEGTYAQRRQDYILVGELALSADPMKLLHASSQQVPSPAQASATGAEFRSALTRVLRRQGRFLIWYFLAISMEGLLLGWLASKYGDWQSVDSERASAAIWLYLQFARRFLLPNVSEWHMLLTGFNWPKARDIVVQLDVLQTDGHLYKGRVVNYFTDPDGKLTGMLLQNVLRFDREGYLKAKEVSHVSDPDLISAFWRPIPSESFYISQSSVANLNVRSAPRTADLLTLTKEALADEDIDADISLSTEANPSVVEGAVSSRQPDLYS
jgi:hypothetical protein